MSETLCVLLVEDSPDDVYFFKRALGKTQVTVDLLLAEDGVQAIELLRIDVSSTTPPSRRPDLIFLDLKMPNANGFDVLKWLGSQPFNPPIHVIVLTSSEEPADVQAAKKLGANLYLTKPISPEQLKHLLEERRKA